MDAGDANSLNGRIAHYKNLPPPTVTTRPYSGSPAPAPEPAPAPTAYNGVCTDAWVTKAVTMVTGRAPNGTANVGDCTITRYGGGSWTSYADLAVKVATAFNWPRGGKCNDLWIVMATVDVRGVLPTGSGTSQQCDPRNYAGGRWNNYADLVKAVKTYYGLP